MSIRIVIICFLLASCSKQYYLPVTEGPAALVSFSNMSYEIPQLTIVEDCKSHVINNEFIENKLPNDKHKISMQIFAGRNVTFVYDYNWLGSGRIELISTGGYAQNMIKRSEVKELESCKQSVSFVPEVNKHYDVYFGMNVETCVIKVSEIFINPETGKKQLFKVGTTEPSECR